MHKIGSFIGLHNRYEILKVLGEGGMSTVYKAYDTILKELIAIKTLHKEFALQDRIKNRFVNEAKICLTLNHPNIIRVRDINIHENSYYIVMEYIEGIELKKIIKENKSFFDKDIQKIYTLMNPIFKALAYAHKYTIHRDIKPSNIMIKEETAYLMDFGISKALENSELENDTISGGMGTKKYISPEQTFNANDVDKRSDIYSAGIVFYELLTNHRPENTAIKEPINPSLFNDKITKNISSVILKMIKPKPEDRYNDFNEIIDELDRFIIHKEDIAEDDDKTLSMVNFKEKDTKNKATTNKNFILIEKGSFIRGSSIESNIVIEKPRKNIYLDDFEIAKYPVTNKEYQSFLKETNYKKPKNFDILCQEYPYHPVINVSYTDALTYCKFYKLSLPSEAQWEKAAKGNKNHIYPWGNTFEKDYANIAFNLSTIVDVKEFKKGINPFGIYQLAGNIWEWCLDDFEDDYYKKSPERNPICLKNTNQKVLRGGSFDFIEHAARTSFRFSSNKDACENNIGFRVVRGTSNDF
jgi:serine/threonine-protein kinase